MTKLAKSKIVKVRIKDLTNPIFGATERIAPEIKNKSIGEKLSAILNYEVIEKTKNFVILKVSFVHLTSKGRAF